MTASLTDCPRCSSPQGFVPKLRDSSQGDWQEEFIRCAVCRWEHIIRRTTPAIETLRIKSMQLARRKDYEQERHGQPSATLIARHREVHKELSAMMTDLYRRVKEDGKATTDADPA